MLLYIAICILGVSMMSLPVKDKMLFGLKWGIIRLGIGLVAGAIILMIHSFVLSIVDNQTLAYVFSFGLVRYLEWFLLALVISNKYNVNFNEKTHYWILLGAFASVAIDGIVQYFDLIDNLKFVC